MSNRSPNMSCGGIGALAIFIAPVLFFGVGSFLNWIL